MYGPSLAWFCGYGGGMRLSGQRRPCGAAGTPAAGQVSRPRGRMSVQRSQALCPRPPTELCGDPCEVMARTEAFLGPVATRPSPGSAPRDGALTGVTRAELIEAEKAESARVGSSCRLHQSS